MFTFAWATKHYLPISNVWFNPQWHKDGTEEINLSLKEKDEIAKKTKNLFNDQFIKPNLNHVKNKL